MNEEERLKWLQERRKGIGSSDASAILGLNRYKTAADVAVEKLQDVTSHQESELLELGTDMEPVILKRYVRLTGIKAEAVNKIIYHPKYPFMLASLDALAGEPPYPLEFKNITFPNASEWGTEGTDQVPDEYVVQCQHQIAVAEAEFVEMPVMMYGKLRIYRIDRNQEFIDALIEREKEFWQRFIINKEPLPFDFKHPATLALIKKLWGVDSAKDEVALPAEAIDLVRVYQHWGDVARTADKDKKSAQAQLLYLLQGAPAGRLPDGTVITQKLIQMKGYTVASFTKQSFNIKLPKGVKNAIAD